MIIYIWPLDLESARQQILDDLQSESDMWICTVSDLIYYFHTYIGPLTVVRLTGVSQGTIVEFIVKPLPAVDMIQLAVLQNRRRHQTDRRHQRRVF